jgi:putative FmdB family regulatory protein
MPLYEYECQKCGHRFEEIQKFSDELLKVHEDCGGDLRKLLSAPAIQFKGTGWYVTDYARAGQAGEEAKKRDDAKKSADKKAETKSDSKSETKTESKSESKTKSSDSGSSTKTSSTSKD